MLMFCYSKSINIHFLISSVFLVSCWLQIRVVNAFRQGLDARYGDSATLAEALRKQSSLSKRLSQTSSIEYADNVMDELPIPEIDVERLSSHSHTETAV
jgi:Ca2+ transporting ATPase